MDEPCAKLDELVHQVIGTASTADFLEPDFLVPLRLGGLFDANTPS